MKDWTAKVIRKAWMEIVSLDRSHSLCGRHLPTLSEERPYREGLPNKVVFGMMDEDAPSRLDQKCLDALKQHKGEEPQTGAAALSAASGS